MVNHLVGAYVGGVAHSLACLEHADQAVVAHHLLGAVGEGEGDGQWQSFGNCHDHNRHCSEKQKRDIDSGY